MVIKYKSKIGRGYSAKGATLELRAPLQHFIFLGIPCLPFTNVSSIYLSPLLRIFCFPLLLVLAALLISTHLGATLIHGLPIPFALLSTVYIAKFAATKTRPFGNNRTQALFIFLVPPTLIFQYFVAVLQTPFFDVGEFVWWSFRQNGFSHS